MPPRVDSPFLLLRAGVSVLLVVVAVTGTGCRSPDRGWAVEVDTLAGGTVVVHNSGTPRGAADPSHLLEPDLRIGSAKDGPDGFSRIWGLAIDAPGRMYVFDQSTRDIRVFDASGAFLRTIGRQGSGPGEIENGAGMVIDPSGHIWLADAGNARYTVFDSTGGVVRSVRWTHAGYVVPRPLGFDSAGHLLAMSPVRVTRFQVRDVLLVLDSLLQIRDSILVPYYELDFLELRRPDGRLAMIQLVPFAPSQRWTYDPAGALWLGVSDAYELVERTPAGDTLLVVSVDATPEPVRPEDLTAAAEGFAWYTDAGGQLDLSGVPASKPFFSAIYRDDEANIWVRRTTPSDGPLHTRFDVFGPDGALTGSVVLGVTLESSPRPVIRDGSLYGVVLDDLDIPSVVRIPVAAPTR
jgi:sugar lactone lactonase YvrE